MDRSTALSIASAHGFTLSADFHTLRAEIVERVLNAADACRYRKPRNANGSRARYFYSRLQRAAARRD